MDRGVKRLEKFGVFSSIQKQRHPLSHKAGRAG